MSFEQLDPEEREIIRRSMTVVLNEGLIDDFEFQTRLGIERGELAAVINSYPRIDDKDDGSTASLSINNCLNELCFGVKAKEHAWTALNISRGELLEVYEKWARLRGWKSTGIR